MRSGSNTTLDGIGGQPASVALDPNSTNTVDTELPAPVVLGDSMVNPTVPQVGAHVLGWDTINSIWKRAQVVSLFDMDTSGTTHQYVPGLTLRLAASGGSVPFGTPTNPISVVADIQAGSTDVSTSAPFKIGGHAYSGVPVAVLDGARVNGWFDLKGRLVTRKSFENYTDTFVAAPSTGTAKNYSDNPPMFFSLQISGGGGPAVAWEVVLEVSNDLINYSPIIIHSSAAGDTDGAVKFSTSGATPCTYFRARCIAVTFAGGQSFISSTVTMVTT